MTMMRTVGPWLLIGAAAGFGMLATGAAGAADDVAPALPVPGAKVLFDGKDLSGWAKRGGDQPATWKVENGAMTAGCGDIITREKFQNFRLHVEFMTPLMPDKQGQARGNSGVYMQGRYEIQVLDSYGKARPGTGDCGAVYNQSAPLVNACKPPLQWQSYDIAYRAPRFHDGKLTEKPRVTVFQNGILVQNNTEINGNTVSSVTGEDPATPGPILLQDHGNPVRYRNVWIVPLPDSGNAAYE